MAAEQMPGSWDLHLLSGNPAWAPFPSPWAVGPGFQLNPFPFKEKKKKKLSLLPVVPSFYINILFEAEGSLVFNVKIQKPLLEFF